MRISARNRITNIITAVKNGTITPHRRRHIGAGSGMRKTCLIVALAGIAAPALAAEPSGCDKFKWPIARERTALTATDRAKLASGDELAAVPATGMTLMLVAPGEAKLPISPERAPKEGTYAGFANFKTAPKPGLYTVSLSIGAWVEIVQDGHLLKPKAFSGATDCDGIRKTMKYELAGNPFTLEISGAPATQISVAILPSE